MHESQLLRDLLIYIFPQLQPQDFPHIDLEQSSDAWFETWLNQHRLAHQYVIDCDYQDWANSFDVQLNFLDVIKKPIPIDSTLDEIYEFFEQFEAEDFEDQDDYIEDEDALHGNDEFLEPYSHYFEPSDDVLEPTVVIVENLLNCILSHGYHVLAIMHPYKFQFILSDQKSSALTDLSMLFEDAYSPQQVRLFLTDDYSHHQFAHLIGKL